LDVDALDVDALDVDALDVDALDVEALDVGAHENLSEYLDLLVADGSLVRDGEWYALSARGLADGEAQLATAFTDLIHPVPNECEGECWCHTSEAEAEACTRTRNRNASAAGPEAREANA
jgi:hypothetical protein